MESIYENSALATQEIMLEAEVYTPVRRYAGAKTGKRYESGMFSEIFTEIWGGTKRTLAGLILIAGSLNLLFQLNGFFFKLAQQLRRHHMRRNQDQQLPLFRNRFRLTE